MLTFISLLGMVATLRHHQVIIENKYFGALFLGFTIFLRFGPVYSVHCSICRVDLMSRFVSSPAGNILCSIKISQNRFLDGRSPHGME